jgi:hypothetical protein
MVNETNDLKLYKERLKIDKHDLDTEMAERQLTYSLAVAERSELEKSRRDELKLKIEQTIAELDGQYRSDAAKAGEKATDKSVDREIEITPKIVDLKKQLIAANLSVGMWGALREEYSQRGWMIRDLIQSFVAGYWSKSMMGSSQKKHSEVEADRIRERRSDAMRDRRPDSEREESRPRRR